MLGVGSLAAHAIHVGIGMPTRNPLSVRVLGLKPLDAVGHAQWSQVCPAVVPVSHPFAFQPAVHSRGGTISVSPPSPFTVGWPHGVTP